MSSWQWWTKTCKQITHTSIMTEFGKYYGRLAGFTCWRSWLQAMLSGLREREKRRELQKESNAHEARENYPFKSQTCRLIRSFSQISQGNLCCVRVRPNFRVAEAVRTGGGAGGCLKTVFVLFIVSIGVTGCCRTSCKIFIAEARSKSNWWRTNRFVWSYLCPTHFEPKCYNDW